MSDKQAWVQIPTTGPNYVGWRGELLAELALARVPGIIVTKSPERSSAQLPFDFLVATGDGVCFFVETKAFSSLRTRLHDVETIPELQWSLNPELVQRAHQSHCPVVLFVFDADTEHGRFLRLDTLPAPRAGEKPLMVRLGLDAVITRENLEKMIAGLRSGAAA